MTSKRRRLRVRANLVATLLGIALAATSVAADLTPAQRQGHEVYARWCAPCHDPGIIHPGTHALETKYKGVKSGVIVEWTDLPPIAVHNMVRHGMSIMPYFRKTEISDAELDALSAYLSRNSRGR